MTDRQWLKDYLEDKMAQELHPSESVKLLEKRIKALEKHVFSRGFNPEVKPKVKPKKGKK